MAIAAPWARNGSVGWHASPSRVTGPRPQTARFEALAESGKLSQAESMQLYQMVAGAVVEEQQRYFSVLYLPESSSGRFVKVHGTQRFGVSPARTDRARRHEGPWPSDTPKWRGCGARLPTGLKTLARVATLPGVRTGDGAHRPGATPRHVPSSEPEPPVAQERPCPRKDGFVSDDSR